MKTESKIFDKSNLKGISEELKNEILQRFNDYDTMKRVIITIANKSATNTQWLKR